MAPPFPRSGPGESGSPTSQVVLRCYDFPSRILGHLFVSLPRPTLPSSFVSRGLRSRSQKVRGCLRGRVVVQPATQLPVCSRVDVSGISQVPRRSVPCLCLVPGPRPNRRCLASLRFRRCCPRSLQSEGFSVMEISGLPRGFSTCCLRFTSGVATTHARLASGGRARLYRKGVEPSGSLQKVSDQILILLFWIYPGARRALLHLSYSYATAVWTGVTRDTSRVGPGNFTPSRSQIRT
jgi:hypothetical protein